MSARRTLVLAVLVLCACASDRRTRGGGGGGGTHGDGGTSGGPNELMCSADLQNVVDASGNVVMSCPPTEGCLNGACVPACQAAAGSHGNVGCDFLAATPSFLQDTAIGVTPPCFAVFIANNWSQAVHITVTQGSTSLDPTLFGRIASTTDANAANWGLLPASGLPPGEVAVLFMSSDPSSTNLGHSLACPVAQAVAGATAVQDSGMGVAFKIDTDVPVSAYDILPYGGADSFLPAAELLLPTSAWGTTYVTAVPPNKSNGGGVAGAQFAQVVASADNTTVMIKPTTNLPAGTNVPAAPANVITSVTLNAGEFIQWQDAGEMSGTVLTSDQPVAFVGGNTYLCLTSKTSPTGGGCDSSHQMIPPVSALGNEYAIAPFVTRMATLAPESIPYRFVGAIDGTTLTFDPPITGAPATLGRGVFADFETTQAFVVQSQDASHPFYIAQLMPGGNVTGGSRPGATTNASFGGGVLGDEEFVNELPPAQFLSRYVFFTDPTYSTTNLVITRVAHAGTFSDVTVDCAGTLTNWLPLGSTGNYQYTTIDLVRSAMGIGTCTNGPHTASSSGQFGLMVWGTDSFASYAYPGGGNVGTISTATIIL